MKIRIVLPAVVLLCLVLSGTSVDGTLDDEQAGVDVSKDDFDRNRNPGDEGPDPESLPAAPTETQSCHPTQEASQWENYVCLLSDSELHEVLGCKPEEQATRPIWVRTQTPDGTWSGWERSGDFGCTSPGGPSISDITKSVERAFQSLPIAPSPVIIQPDTGWTFVNIPTIVYTDDRTQTLKTTILGINVEIEVTPTSFAWDFADKSPTLVTTDPGAPYPNHTTAHTYKATGHAAISLTTTWTGRFRTGTDDAWKTINGEAHTTSAAVPLTIYEAQSRLVEDSL